MRLTAEIKPNDILKMDRLRTLLLGIFGLTTSAGSVAVVSAAQVKEWAELLILSVGGITAIMSIYWMHKINRVTLTKEELELCKECQNGVEPPICPLSRSMRPKNCPKNLKRK